MTAIPIPRRLPTLEPVRIALAKALVDDLADTLAELEAELEARGLPAITLPPPAAVLTQFVRNYTDVAAWPTVAVTTYALRPREESEQGAGTGWMRGTIDVSIWLRSSASEMDAALERYGVAIWLVAKDRDPIAGCELAENSLAISPDPTGGTANQRGNVITLDVLLRL